MSHQFRLSLATDFVSRQPIPLVLDHMRYLGLNLYDFLDRRGNDADTGMGP